MRLGSAGARAGRRGERGVATTETLLVMPPLIILFAALLQIYLIDRATFRLATTAHMRLFTLVAWPQNRPDVPYESETMKWDGPEQYVPVVGHFRMYGLTPADLRIRSVRVPSPPGGYKRIKLGRGTESSVAAGLQGLADPSGLLWAVQGAFGDITSAIQLRRSAGPPPGGRP